MVVVPFHEEDPAVVIRTLDIAATHPSVARVVAVAGHHGPTTRAVLDGIPGKSGRVDLVTQARFGSLRSGKGDAVNTGFHRFLEDTDCERIHFYDADIKTFGPEWISKAEHALDLGFATVRHYYPRAATDAMITWMITRPAFALLWPDSHLARLHQPLSGELAFTRAAAEVVAGDPLVRGQSDWGVDTAITFATVRHGLSIYQSYLSVGKDHALYGSLLDIKVMMLECLAALQRLRSFALPRSPAELHIEDPVAVSSVIAQQIGFDVEATQRVLAGTWTEVQIALLESYFPGEVARAARQWTQWPDTTAMDEDNWMAALRVLLDRFELDDPDWQELAFRLWVGRVLHYTLRVAVRGHGYASGYLSDMVERAIVAAQSPSSRLHGGGR